MSELSSFEQLERSRRRRKFAIIAGMGAIGGIGGGILGAREADHLFDPAYPWPPLLCLAMVAVLLVAIAVCGIILRRQTDEVERLAKLKAAHAGASVYAAGYPIWFLLWKGGFVPEPMHVALYAAMMIVILLASLFYKFR